jgi:pilus assembly protein TadC
MEPVYKWEPVTDLYKTEAAESVTSETIEAESQQKLQELHEAAKKKVWIEKKAPIGIRIFTWYLFGRAGFYFILLSVLAVFPQSGASTWLVGSMVHFLPGAAAREQAAKQREEIKKEFEDQGYTLPDDDPADQESPEQMAQEQREFVMVYLVISAVLTSVVGFMWWNHSWKIRWITMFYAGAFVAKAAIGYFSAVASGMTGAIDTAQMPLLMASIAVNGFVFCYLAFWPDVKEWFEGQP